MQNFVCHIPTRIFFGKNQIEVLGQEVKKYGSRVLLVYGGGSIKRHGIYDAVTRVLKENRSGVMGVGGIPPNRSLYSAQRDPDFEKE